MYMPSIFGESLFDNMFPFDEKFFTEKKDPLYGKNASRLMKTDVRETEKTYELDIDLPGFKKDEIKAELKDGYMTITAASDKDNKIEDENSRYICRERVYSNCSRTFYVGKELTQEDIKAKFENGVLTLNVPKKEALPQKEEDKYISIL